MDTATATSITITGELDERDQSRAIEAIRQRHTITAPMVGDLIIFSDDEPPVRITHEWGGYDDPKDACGYQTTLRLAGTAINHCGFFLYGHGVASYSGSLDPPIPGSELQPTDELRMVTFWFFRHGEARAHNGVYFQAPVRVWRYTGTTKPVRTGPPNY